MNERLEDADVCQLPMTQNEICRRTVISLTVIFVNLKPTIHLYFVMYVLDYMSRYDCSTIYVTINVYRCNMCTYLNCYKGVSVYADELVCIVVIM